MSGRGFPLALALVAASCFSPTLPEVPHCQSDDDCAYGQVCDTGRRVCAVTADEMRPIAAGPFTMGCNTAAGEIDCDSDETSHTVTLSAFRIDTLEVTESAYAQCLDAGGCTTPAEFSPVDARDRPVRGVTHDQAAAFCAWRGKRLPTEAEWEHACRGDDRRIFPWGNQPPDCTRANMAGCGGAVVMVGSLPDGESPAMVFDLSGNVSEWVADWYSAAYYAASEGASDPLGPDEADAGCVSGTGQCKVTRGGHYGRTASDLRCGDREPELPASSFPDLGFRCADDAR